MSTGYDEQSRWLSSQGWRFALCCFLPYRAACLVTSQQQSRSPFLLQQKTVKLTPHVAQLCQSFSIIRHGRAHTPAALQILLWSPTLTQASKGDMHCLLCMPTWTSTTGTCGSSLLHCNLCVRLVPMGHLCATWKGWVTAAVHVAPGVNMTSLLSALEHWHTDLDSLGTHTA